MNIQHIDEHYIPFARVLPILKEVARGELYWDDSDNQYCLFCDYDRWLTGKKVHNQECPVVRARAILREQGMSLHVYTLTCEYRAANSKRWYTAQAVVIDYSEEEAKARIPASPDLDDLRNSKRRNVQITACREIEENEAEP